MHIFGPGRHGFDPMTEVVEEASFPISVCLPGLRREYLHLLLQIGGIFEVTLETSRTRSFSRRQSGWVVVDSSSCFRSFGTPEGDLSSHRSLGRGFDNGLNFWGSRTSALFAARLVILQRLALDDRLDRHHAQVWLSRNSALLLLRRQVRQVILPLDKPLPVGGIPLLSDSSPRRDGRHTLDDVGREEAAPRRDPPPPTTGSTGDPPTGQATSGGGDPPTERQQPEEGWETYSRQRGEGGGRPPAPPTQQWVPTGNRFSVLQEEVPTCAPDIGPSSRPTSSSGTSCALFFD